MALLSVACVRKKVTFDISNLLESGAFATQVRKVTVPCTFLH